MVLSGGASDEDFFCCCLVGSSSLVSAFTEAIKSGEASIVQKDIKVNHILT